MYPQVTADNVGSPIPIWAGVTFIVSGLFTEDEERSSEAVTEGGAQRCFACKGAFKKLDA
jgi:hypothetical protein